MGPKNQKIHNGELMFRINRLSPKFVISFVITGLMTLISVELLKKNTVSSKKRGVSFFNPISLKKVMTAHFSSVFLHT